MFNQIKWIALLLLPVALCVAGEVRHNPFAPVQASVVIDPSLQPLSERQKGPLENFALKDLHYVGHMQDHQRTWGLVQDKAGRVHRVGVGDYVGLHHGKVSSISDQYIRLDELVAAKGGYTKRVSLLELNRLAGASS